MQKKSIQEINEIYDLELNKILNTIKKHNYKKILLQFPDGLKLYVLEITNYLQENTKSNFFIWLGSCFGACDIPQIKNIDLTIQFGHNEFGFEKIH